ncbi:MAG: prepilin-type N-terminal cleavage/methylation domain-containing protein [Polyangiales bacterium]
MSSRRHSRSGFTLLEVMLAVAIMSVALGAVFAAEAGSVKMAQRARKLGFATLLSRCKMGEIEEHLAKMGLPLNPETESDNCCKDAPIDGFECKWEVVPIVLPDTMFNPDEEEDGKSGSGSNASASSGQSSGSDKGGLNGMLGAAAAALGVKKPGETGEGSDPKDAKDKNTDEKKDPKDLLSGDPSRFLSGDNTRGSGAEIDSLTAMAMQFVYPVLKPAFQSQIRRVSVTVNWFEGSAAKTYDLTQYYVAEQPTAIDPNNPNAQLGAGSQGQTPGTSTTTPPLTVPPVTGAGR